MCARAPTTRPSGGWGDFSRRDCCVAFGEQCVRSRATVRQHGSSGSDRGHISHSGTAGWGKACGESTTHHALLPVPLVLPTCTASHVPRHPYSQVLPRLRLRALHLHLHGARHQPRLRPVSLAAARPRGRGPLRHALGGAGPAQAPVRRVPGGSP